MVQADGFYLFLYFKIIAGIFLCTVFAAYKFKHYAGYVVTLKYYLRKGASDASVILNAMFVLFFPTASTELLNTDCSIIPVSIRHHFFSSRLKPMPA